MQKCSSYSLLPFWSEKLVDQRVPLQEYPGFLLSKKSKLNWVRNHDGEANTIKLFTLSCVVSTPVDLLGKLKLLWDWFSESWDFLNKKTVKFDDLKWYRARAVNLLQLLTLPYLAQVTRLSRKASGVFVLPADREQFSKMSPLADLKHPGSLKVRTWFLNH